MALVKTLGGLTYSLAKTVSGLSVASIKTIDGLDASGQTFLVNQNFEGTGTDNGETWTTSGATTDFDYATSPIVGSQSCRIFENPTTASAKFTFTTQAGDVWAFCRLRINTFSLTATNHTFDLQNSAATAVVVGLNFYTSGGVNRIALKTNGTLSADSAFAPSTGVNYYCWLHWVPGGGTCEGWVSSTSTRTSTDSASNCYLTKAGASGQNCGIVDFWTGNNSAGADYVFDHVLVSPTSIGNNP